MLDAIVGTSGNSGCGLAVAMPSARALPSLIIAGTGPASGWKAMSTVPPTRSVISGPTPLYGTCVNVTPACYASFSAIG